MKLLEAVCLNLSLKSSESRIAFLSTGSSSAERIIPGTVAGSTFLGRPSMKLSSEIVTDTFAPMAVVSL